MPGPTAPGRFRVAEGPATGTSSHSECGLVTSACDPAPADLPNEMTRPARGDRSGKYGYAFVRGICLTNKVQ